MTRGLLAIAVVVLAFGLAACGQQVGGSSSALQVVAAENFWGSVVSQLGGSHVHVTSIISSPDIDPHDYESKPSDGRALARARYVLVNGLGYDGWADRALAANRSTGRRVLRVQDLLALKDSDNPHRWYSPDDVLRVIDRITADLKELDPANASSYDTQRAAFLETGLRAYRSAADEIKRNFAGVAVGATESVVVPLVESLGLRLASPASFLNAIAEGADPTPQDKAAMEAQIRQHQIRVLLVNKQNLTPDVQRLVEAARGANVPVVEVTETLSPPNATFQEWQTAQLQALAKALAGTR
jgi:zinc/manganese transport system substrate-binding protein